VSKSSLGRVPHPSNRHDRIERTVKHYERKARLIALPFECEFVHDPEGNTVTNRPLPRRHAERLAVELLSVDIDATVAATLDARLAHVLIAAPEFRRRPTSPDSKAIREVHRVDGCGQPIGADTDPSPPPSQSRDTSPCPTTPCPPSSKALEQCREAGKAFKKAAALAREALRSDSGSYRLLVSEAHVVQRRRASDAKKGSK